MKSQKACAAVQHCRQHKVALFFLFQAYQFKLVATNGIDLTTPLDECSFIYLYICVCVCICIYINI